MTDMKDIAAPLTDFHCKEAPCKPIIPPPGTTITFAKTFKTYCGKEKEENACDLIRHTLQMYKPQEVMLSFNGGKDCTVLLHLITQFFKRQSCLRHLRLPVIYIQQEESFEEINEFVDFCGHYYNIELLIVQGPIKEVLFDICSQRPHIKAIFLGSRNTDPNCDKLKFMTPCDPHYPPLMRVCPLLYWDYKDIWNYIFRHKVPYCNLYDQGYTSIGGKNNTNKNPQLRLFEEKTRRVSYRPAYELLDENGDAERVGRC